MIVLVDCRRRVLVVSASDLKYEEESEYSGTKDKKTKKSQNNKYLSHTLK